LGEWLKHRKTFAPGMLDAYFASPSTFKPLCVNDDDLETLFLAFRESWKIPNSLVERFDHLYFHSNQRADLVKIVFDSLCKDYPVESSTDEAKFNAWTLLADVRTAAEMNVYADLIPSLSGGGHDINLETFRSTILAKIDAAILVCDRASDFVELVDFGDIFGQLPRWRHFREGLANSDERKREIDREDTDQKIPLQFSGPVEPPPLSHNREQEIQRLKLENSDKDAKIREMEMRLQLLSVQGELDPQSPEEDTNRKKLKHKSCSPCMLLSEMARHVISLVGQSVNTGNGASEGIKATRGTLEEQKNERRTEERSSNKNSNPQDSLSLSSGQPNSSNNQHVSPTQIEIQATAGENNGVALIKQSIDRVAGMVAKRLDENDVVKQERFKDVVLARINEQHSRDSARGDKSIYSGATSALFSGGSLSIRKLETFIK
jgi:hypothetical protein